MEGSTSKTNYKVSIVMLSYNHERYISQALDSAIKQNTDFNFEIVVNDDCSKDNTVKIVSEYQAKYPEIVRLATNDMNAGIPANMYKALERCCGEYICILSGDDYFIDDYKLQKQVDFLTKNPQFLSVATRTEAVAYPEMQVLSYNPDSRYLNSEFTLGDFLMGYNFPTAGLMFRNIMRTQTGKSEMQLMTKASKYIDDLTMCLVLLQQGRLYVLEDTTYAYRVRRSRDDNNFNSINDEYTAFVKHIDLLNYLYKYYDSEIDLYYRYERLTSVHYWLAFKQGQFSKVAKVHRTVPSGLKTRIMISAFKYSIKHIFELLLSKKGAKNEH